MHRENELAGCKAFAMTDEEELEAKHRVAVESLVSPPKEPFGLGVH